MPHLGAAGRPGQAYVPIILETSNQKLKDGTWPPAPALRSIKRPDPKLFDARFTPG